MEFGQAGLKKVGLPRVKLLSNHLLLSKHHLIDDCETRVSHHTFGCRDKFFFFVKSAVYS